MHRRFDDKRVLKEFCCAELELMVDTMHRRNTDLESEQ